jgi:hypothetical protein
MPAPDPEVKEVAEDAAAITPLGHEALEERAERSGLGRLLWADVDVGEEYGAHEGMLRGARRRRQRRG